MTEPLPAFVWVVGHGALVAHAMEEEESTGYHGVAVCGLIVGKPDRCDQVRHCKRCSRQIQSWKRAAEHEAAIAAQILSMHKPRGD